MNPAIAQQVFFYEALVSTDDRVTIRSCNIRIDPKKTPKKATYQVVLDILKLSPYYNAFLITGDVLEIYMQQFWFAISKVKDSLLYQFKLYKKKFKIGIELFCEILQICPKVPNVEFVAPPPHVAIVTFIESLGYKGSLESLLNLYTNHMYQPWRTFASIINRFLFRKTSDVMVNEDIKNSKAYKIYLALSTRAEIPKNARKGTKEPATPKKISSITTDKDKFLT
nr:hypothetical protein [Tanacetum cinerariifolium]